MFSRFRALAVVMFLAAGGAVALTTSAQAVTWPCASTATIKSVHDQTANHTGHVIRYGDETPTGAPWSGRTLTHGHFFELHGASVVVAFGRATYRLDHNAIFALGCSGTAAGQPASYPDMRLLNGRVVVSDPRGGYSGSTSTFEALVGPVVGDARAVKFTVSRTLTQKKLTLMQKIHWFAGYIDQPKGRTAAASSSPPKINITPYVGPQPGTCRHCHSSTLTSTGTSGLKPTGTSTYH